MRGEADNLLDCDVLVSGAIVIACREAKACPHKVTWIKLDLIAEQGSNVRVLVLASQLLKDDLRFWCRTIVCVDVAKVGLTDYFE